MNSTDLRRTATQASALLKYELQDNLVVDTGRVFLTGTQALVRLPLMQRRKDRRKGLNTSGFISGYRGSPLGGYDQALWRVKALLEDHQIKFLPGVNEELAATAVFGSQQVESDPERTVDGVFGIWYGKGPGVDRAGDALKHGNVYGSSPHGGVLVVAGDDHGCVSSSMPHQSDFAMQAWSMPIVNPSNVQEYLEFGMYGWALSRFSGAWVGFKAISETVESGSTVDLDAIRCEFDAPVDFVAPDGGLHYRWPDMPSLTLESRLATKLRAVRAFARANSIDKMICTAPEADIGIVACGKAYLDFLEALRGLGLDLEQLNDAGVRVYKPGLTFPIEATRMQAFADGLRDILVIEEKGPVVERQIKDLFYNMPDARRPRVVGKLDRHGQAMLSDLGELRPSRIAPVLMRWWRDVKPALCIDDVPACSAGASSGGQVAAIVRRTPYFCSGCPHNTSTRVPEGSKARAGIGCHFMVTWMDRSTTGLTQMGGEGVDWVAQGMFSKTRHVFQNLGDGTYFHSGFLAVRQAIAAGSNVTYKILFNDAVAMTGGQPMDGTLTVDKIAWQVSSEGARKVAVVAEQIERYDGLRAMFPAGTTFHPRHELDAVQRQLRDEPGVTVLIYDQVCAAEKRRRIKRETAPAQVKRTFIDTEVCEGCGDCGVQSNCLSIAPVETVMGRKRAIEQSSCNLDFSCVKGHCPSFVTVIGAQVRGKSQVQLDATRLDAQLKELPLPSLPPMSDTYNLLVTGVGGTGVVTVGAMIAMAAHLEGKSASVLDFMGFAQKGGAVLSFVRVDARPDGVNQARIDVQQADALLACDLVVANSPDALQALRSGHTRVLANGHVLPTSGNLRDPEFNVGADNLAEALRAAVGGERFETVNAHRVAREFLGDSIFANVIMLGYAWQRGLVPVGLEALMRALELNAVAVAHNRMAFSIGRIAAGNHAGLSLLQTGEAAPSAPASLGLDELIEQRFDHLVAYQDTQLGRKFLALVERVRLAEQALDLKHGLRLTRAIAESYSRLLAYKDEYEVARLLSSPGFEARLRQQFVGEFRFEFNLALPMLNRLLPVQKETGKVRFGQWFRPVLSVMAKARTLRGRWYDPFAHSEERRAERRMIADFESLVDRMLPKLSEENLERAVNLVNVLQTVRGYGHVKARNMALARERIEVLWEDYVAEHHDTADMELSRIAAQPAVLSGRVIPIQAEVA